MKKSFVLFASALVIASAWHLPVTAQRPAAGAPELEALKRLAFRNIGPANQAGRISVIVGVPGDPSTFYVAGANGGVFKTGNAGTTWKPIFDNQNVLSIGEIALAPSNPDVVYVGTGEENPRNNASFGDGVYRSNDGGETWMHVGLEDSDRIARIRVDSRNPDIVYACAMGHEWGPNEQRGVFKSADGGKNWQKILFKDTLTGCSDIDVNPANSNEIYAGMRTFASLSAVRLGFDPDPLLIVNVSAKRSAIPPDDRALLYERARQAVLAVPNVRTAALESIAPLTNSEWNTLIENPPGLSLSEDERTVWVNAVSPDWFATYGIPLLAGRDFTTHDDRNAPKVILVNETLAKKYFGGANPVGRSIRNDPSPGENPPPLQIIGLVRDSVYDSLRDKIPPTMYQPVPQQKKPGPSIEIAVHAASGSPALLSRGIAEAIARVDGDVTVEFRPLQQSVRDFTVQERVTAMSGVQVYACGAPIMAAVQTCTVPQPSRK